MSLAPRPCTAHEARARAPHVRAAYGRRHECATIRRFEEAELRQRFRDIDEDNSGTIELHEYLQWALRAALARSQEKLSTLFAKWDRDGS